MIALDLVTRQTIAVILGLIGKKFEVKEAKKEKEQGDQDQDPKVDLKERREEGAQAIALGQATTQGQTSTGIGENDQDLTLEALPIQVAEALLRQARHRQGRYTGKDAEKGKKLTAKIGSKYQLKILLSFKQQQGRHRQL